MWGSKVEKNLNIPALERDEDIRQVSRRVARQVRSALIEAVIAKPVEDLTTVFGSGCIGERATGVVLQFAAPG
ncbi:hypothetical protein [Nocardia tengchongensis]|uniref:hypothetical protein n=1 Tax=Nocardia tengchongensis TaxID=2055889 RepID=UPI0036510DAF